MVPEQGVDGKRTQYERKICDLCGGEIPLTKDGKLRLHRQRNHHNYGVAHARVPYCAASRSRMHSGVDRQS